MAAGANALQGRAARALPQHHLLRPLRRRHRGGGPGVLRRPCRASLTWPSAPCWPGCPSRRRRTTRVENLKAAQTRQAVVLGLMVGTATSPPTQAEQAGGERLAFATTPFPIEAPHFVMWVQSQLEALLGANRVRARRAAGDHDPRPGLAAPGRGDRAPAPGAAPPVRGWLRPCRRMRPRRRSRATGGQCCTGRARSRTPARCWPWSVARTISTRPSAAR